MTIYFALVLHNEKCAVMIIDVRMTPAYVWFLYYDYCSWLALLDLHLYGFYTMVSRSQSPSGPATPRCRTGDQFAFLSKEGRVKEFFYKLAVTNV